MGALQYVNEAIRAHTIAPPEGGRGAGKHHRILGHVLAEIEEGKPMPPDFPIVYLTDARKLLTAAGVWQDWPNTETPVDFYVTAKRCRNKVDGLHWKVDTVMDRDGYWWQYLSFGTHVKIGDRVLLTNRMDGSPVQVVEVETLGRDKQGSTMYAVINGEHRIRTAQPVVVGRK